MPPCRDKRAVGVALVALVALVACAERDRDPEAAGLVAAAEPDVPDGDAPAHGSKPVTLPEAQITPTLIGSVPGVATSLVASPDGRELLVSTQDGRVFRIRRERVSGSVVPMIDPDPVLDLSDVTRSDELNGLLGMAVSPSGAWLLVDRVDTTQGLVVDRLAYTPGAPLDPGSLERVAVLQRPGGTGHLGGSLAFALDDTLLVAVGDQGFTAPIQNGVIVPGSPVQDPASHLGAVLGIEFDEGSGTARSEPTSIAFGLRQPWRISVDGDLGDLWIGDVGLHRIEEVDFVPLDRLGGEPENFEWPYREGSAPGRLPGAPEAGVGPMVERHHGVGVCGIVGGYVYRGRRLAELYGAYLFGDLCSSEIRALVHRRGRPPLEAVVATTTETTVAFGEGADGEVYVLGSAGAIFRLDPGTPPTVAAAVEYESSGPADDVLEPSCAVVRSIEALAGTIADPAVTFAELQQALDALRAVLRHADEESTGATHAEIVVLRGLFREIGARLDEAASGAGSASAAAFVQTMASGRLADDIGSHVYELNRLMPDACN